jgi:uncharacterized membrane protein
MMRETLVQRGVGNEEGLSWRGGEVSRIEGFSDAVFAFAVTLLVVSLEVPDTFDELLTTMRGFFAFAICFWLLFVVWSDQYRFFRRYGLEDRFTMLLNAILLYLVLFYVYPLKFLFTFLMDELLGYSSAVSPSTEAVIEKIEPEQMPLLMVIYGAGFIAVGFVFFLLYLRAYSLRETLELNAYERSVTREQLQSFMINMGVGLISIAIALLGGEEAASWAGTAYLLLFPTQIANGYLMGRHRRKIVAAASPKEKLNEKKAE